MRDAPKEPIPFLSHKTGKVFKQTEPYETLKKKLKAKADEEYKTQKAKAERELKAHLAKLKADIEREHLKSKIDLIEQRCEELGILTRERVYTLARARMETDITRLKKMLSWIEKAIIATEEEARIRQQMPHNLARFFEALGEIATMSRHRTRSFERESYSRTDWIKHYPWEEGSNEMEVETIAFDYCGDGPEWIEEEWLEWERKQEERSANRSKDQQNTLAKP